MGKKYKSRREFFTSIVFDPEDGLVHNANRSSAAPVILFGAALNGGILGSSPAIPTVSTTSTQVNMQYDFRQLYATILQNWMCMSSSQSQTILNTTSTTNTALALFNSVALPLDNIDISAVWDGNTAQIDFLVQGNDGYESFVVERATDGSSFAVVGVVNIIQGKVAQPYRYNDNRISAPKIFYRIKGMLKDGSEKYSGTAALSNGARIQALSIYPNPVTNYTIHVDFIEDVATLVEVELYDMQGSRMYYNSMAPDNGRLIFRVPYGLGSYVPYIIRVKWGGTEVREQISFV